MQPQQKYLPIWIRVVAGIFALMDIGAGVSSFLSSQSLTETVDLKAKRGKFPIIMQGSMLWTLGLIWLLPQLN